VTFNVAKCVPEAKEITTWVPQTTEILVWKTTYDIEQVLLPTLKLLKVEQDEIKLMPNITTEERDVAIGRSDKLKFGIDGWTSTLSRNQVSVHNLVLS